MEDKEIGKFREYTVMYTEDYNTICDKCCLADCCLKEEFCMCDSYRWSHDIDLEGDIYFTKQ